jgi:hypothetical protein
MANEHIRQRLAGIQRILSDAYHAGHYLTSATKGTEREQFINLFLSQLLPPHFRFGTGDITDQRGHKSGQIDIVIEFPFYPSIPVIGANLPRLYLAEGVAAAVEIKSSIDDEWGKILKTATQLAAIRRNYSTIVQAFGPLNEIIPFFAVGYTGWKQVKTAQEKLRNSHVHGILVIDAGIFVSNEAFRDKAVEGPWALWAFVTCLQQAVGHWILPNSQLLDGYSQEQPD